MRHSPHIHREPAGLAGRGPAARPLRTKTGPPAAIDVLKSDHLNFQRLLRVFESELALFHAAETPDYGIMRDVMHYVTNYPDRVHHPMEELIFERLLRVEPDARRPVEDLQQEHEWLTATGTELLHLLDEILSDALIPRETVESLAHNYAQRLRAHMEMEEAAVFPMAAARLTPKDWAAIAAASRKTTDPLFGSAQADQTYRAIRERLAGPGFAAGSGSR